MTNNTSEELYMSIISLLDELIDIKANKVIEMKISKKDIGLEYASTYNELNMLKRFRQQLLLFSR